MKYIWSHPYNKALPPTLKARSQCDAVLCISYHVIKCILRIMMSISRTHASCILRKNTALKQGIASYTQGRHPGNWGLEILCIVMINSFMHHTLLLLKIIYYKLNYKAFKMKIKVASNAVEMQLKPLTTVQICL